MIFLERNQAHTFDYFYAVVFNETNNLQTQQTPNPEAQLPELVPPVKLSFKLSRIVFLLSSCVKHSLDFGSNT